MIILLLLVVFCVVCKSIDNSIDATSISLLNTDISINERNLNLNTHHELAPLYDRGDPRVIRRKLTRSPSRKSPTPTKTFKPSRRMKPTSKPSIKAPTAIAGNSIIPLGTIFKDATNLVYVVNTATQYTTYKSDGTCTTWPYHATGNVFMTVAKAYTLSKNGTTISGTDMSDSSKTSFTILNSNPHAKKCISSKSNRNTYSNILDTFKKGDKYQNIDDETMYW